jgi:lipopolysaccharide assembly outer membrane protein LptD (OstA)
MRFGKKIQIILFCLSSLIFFYSYYYLPGKNEGSIKVKSLPSKGTKEEIKNKNTFTNVEYKSKNSQGQIFTTKAKESFLDLSKPDLINLIDPYSVTKLKKDKSLIEIKSEIGIFDKKKNIVMYEKNVTIKNKNYLITSNKAAHFSSKNIIIIVGNVVMKDFTMGLSHIIYCDKLEIDTITNNTVATMNSSKDKVIAKKIK